MVKTRKKKWIPIIISWEYRKTVPYLLGKGNHYLIVICVLNEPGELTFKFVFRNTARKIYSEIMTLEKFKELKEQFTGGILDRPKIDISNDYKIELDSFENTYQEFPDVQQVDPLTINNDNIWDTF